MNNYSILKGFIVLIAALVMTQYVSAQTSSVPNEEFSIAIEYDTNTMKLACKKGCAWQTLEFSIGNAYQAVFVNQQGMSDETMDSVSHANSEGFYFSVRKDSSTIIFERIQGTNWNSVSMKCGEVSCFGQLTEEGIEVN